MKQIIVLQILIGLGILGFVIALVQIGREVVKWAVH